MKCAVNKCKNNNGNKAYLSFFTFPTDEKLLKQWLQFCRLDKTINPKTANVCMDHFRACDFENTTDCEMGFTRKRILKRGAIPTIKIIAKATEIDEKHKAKIQKCENKRIVDSVPQENNADAASEQNNLNSVHFETLFIPNVAAPSSSIDLNLANEETFSEEQFELKPIVLEDFPDNQEELLAIGEDFPGELEESTNVNGNSDIPLQRQIELLRHNIEKMRKDNLHLMKTQLRDRAAINVLTHDYELAEKKRVHNIQELKRNLLKIDHANRNMEQKLKSIFSKGQVNCLKNSIKEPLWTKEDITQSIKLHTECPKLYELLYNNSFPLPPASELKNWMKSFRLREKNSR